MRTLQDIPDLANKKVFLRADFDVPVRDDGKIGETFRIKKQRETLDYLLSKGARVVMAAHISAVETFQDLLPQLEELLGQKISFVGSPEDLPKYLDNYPGLGLLDNIRIFRGETNNDSEFAEKLAHGFDYYVNNAFAVCHRNHASVSAVTKFLPSFAGLLVFQEVMELQKMLAAPSLGKVVVIGGAKASTKVPVIHNFLDKADSIIVGGVVANDILCAKGFDIGTSKCDINIEEIIGTLDLKNDKIILPHDFNIMDNKILDIGPQSAERFESILRRARMIIWNGPMGVSEISDFSGGTNAVARAIVASGAVSILGGGDTIAAVNRLGILDKFSFVSTGGGAMLEYLAGRMLPGLAALENRA